MMKRSFILSLVMILAVSCLSGCGGGGGSSSASPAPAPVLTPSISTQSSLDFGVAVIGSSSIRQLLISNVGTGTLAVGQLSLPINSPFRIITDGCSGQSISSQANCGVTIQLTPTSQTDHSGTLTIPSNDGTKNPLTVALTGEGCALNLKINDVKTDGCGNNPKVLKLLVSVTTSAGVPVPGLSSNNFAVSENGVQKPIGALMHPITTPISVDLVLDYSGSLSATDRSIIENAAKSFVAKLVNGVDEGAVMKFALTIGAKTDFTTNQSVLNAAIDAPYPGNTGGTILYDALITAIDDTALRANSRRAIIVFSDGFDEESTHPLTAVIDRAILKGIPIFAIAYTNAANPKPEIMQQLAQQTRGEFFLAPSITDVQGIYAKISDILSSAYLIEYVSDSTGGITVPFHVEVNNNGNLGEDSIEKPGC
jgi:Ca-activated chloride channel family protein